MNTKTARELFEQLQKNLGSDLLDVLAPTLDDTISIAEARQDEVNALTAEQRAELKDDEEYECDGELRDALEAVDEAFEEIIGAIEDQREALDKAERLINEAFGYGLDIDDRAAA